MTFFDENFKKFHSEKNLLTFSLDLDPELDPDPHSSKRLYSVEAGWVSDVSMSLQKRIRYLTDTAETKQKADMVSLRPQNLVKNFQKDFPVSLRLQKQFPQSQYRGPGFRDFNDTLEWFTLSQCQCKNQLCT
jgi:hypothetical protein